MSLTLINEQQIVEALHRVPPTRWGEVLDFLGKLQSVPQAPEIAELAARIWTAAELQQWPRAMQDAILREQASRLVDNHGRAADEASGLAWWQAREIGQLPRE